MRVAIAHQAVDRGAAPEEQDVLVQVAHVAGALEQLGYATAVVPCTLDLQSLAQRLEGLAPHVVFNLVESLGQTDRLAVLVPLLLEARHIPYTGCPAAALLATNDKPAAKRRFRASGLPTPAWWTRGGGGPADDLAFPGRFIVKCAAEHASLGLDDSAVVWAENLAQLDAALAARQDRLGRPCLAEQFIDGREFNLSLLQRAEGPRLLPPAEISFAQFPPGKPRIVGYDAKRQATSLEYHATPTGRCWTNWSSWRCAAGRHSTCAVTRGSTSASMRQAAPGCWKSMPTPACPPTAASRPHCSAPACRLPPQWTTS